MTPLEQFALAVLEESRDELGDLASGVGPADVFPVPKRGKRGLKPGPWMPGAEKPVRDGMYLRRWEWSDDEAYSFYRGGVWYASAFWDSRSDHQDIPWRGGVRPNV